MLKMFSTQLQGLLNRIYEKEELTIEEGARLLAQAAVGDGKIFIIGHKEMKSVEIEAIYGAEPLKGVHEWKGKESFDSLSFTDRVIILSRFSNDPEAIILGKKLKEKDIPFVAVSTVLSSSEENLANLADVHIDLRLLKGLLPDEAGNRFGYPASIAALYVYYGLKFTIEEILEEYE